MERCVSQPHPTTHTHDIADVAEYGKGRGEKKELCGSRSANAVSQRTLRAEMSRYPRRLSNALESQSTRCEFGRNLADNVKEGYLRIETRLAEYGKIQMPSTMLLHGY